MNSGGHAKTFAVGGLIEEDINHTNGTTAKSETSIKKRWEIHLEKR